VKVVGINVLKFALTGLSNFAAPREVIAVIDESGEAEQQWVSSWPSK